MREPQLPTPSTIARQLHDKSAPFYVVQNYWNTSRAAEARFELQAALKDCFEANEDGGDRRRLGLNEAASSGGTLPAGAAFPHATAFAVDNYLQRVASAYLRSRKFSKFNTKVQAGLARAGDSSAAWQSQSGKAASEDNARPLQSSPK